jgi:hypothetical protein
MGWRILDEPGTNAEDFDLIFTQLFDNLEPCAQRLGVAPLADLIEQFFVRNRDDTVIVMIWDIARRADLLARRLRMSEIAIANRRFDLARHWLQACWDEAHDEEGQCRWFPAEAAKASARLDDIVGDASASAAP